MTLLSYIYYNLGRRLTAPGGLGGECVDGVNVYLHDCFATGPIHANAVDWVSAALPGWKWEANGPSNSPPYGAIVVWGASASVGIGQYGHVGVAIRSASLVLVTLDQNWPEGAPLSFVPHNYAGVLGWWIPPHTP